MKKIFAKIILKLTYLYIKMKTWKHYNILKSILHYITLPIIFIYKTLKKIYIRIVKHKSQKVLNKYMSETCQLVLGLPGSGKTTLAAYLAKCCVNVGVPVYTNFKCSLSGVYNFSDLGKYDFGRADGVSYWIFDEAGIDANNRNFKSTFQGDSGRQALEHLKLMRHYKCRVVILSQSMDCDIKLRSMCSKIWLLFKGPICSNLTPVQRSIGCDEVQHQLMDMYDIASPFRRAFQRFYFFRRPYYKYFDTHERPALPHISEKNGSPLKSEENTGSLPGSGVAFCSSGRTDDIASNANASPACLSQGTASANVSLMDLNKFIEQFSQKFR